MKKKSRRLLMIAGGLAAVVVIVLLILVLTVDVNRFRGLIETRAEAALGREVELGEMQLSLWPVFGLRVDDVKIGALPEEGGGELLTAGSLRVGARLGPLLKKELEVTSIVVEEPAMTLARDAGGSWNVERLIARDETGSAEESAAGEGAGGGFSIERLRVTGGRITVRDAYLSSEKPLEITLRDLELELEDFGPGRRFRFELATAFAGADTRLKLAGEGGPLSEVEPLALSADLELEEVARDLVAPWAAALGMPLDSFLGQRPWSARGRLETGAAGLSLADLEISGAEVELRRRKDGSWSFPTPAAGPAGETGGAAEGEAGTGFSLTGLEITGTRVRLIDQAGDRPRKAGPLELVLDDLELTLDRLPTDGPATLRLASRLETGGGGGGGRIEVSGRLGPVTDRGLRLDLSIRGDRLPLAALSGMLPIADDGDAGATTLELQLAGDLPESFTAAGDLELDGARIVVGERADLEPLDLEARFDLAVRQGGESFDIKTLDLVIADRPLSLKGSVESAAEGRRVDLILSPTRLPAGELTALANLFSPDLGLDLRSEEPIELAARARGLMAGERMPELTGSLKFRDLDLRHPAISRPVTGASAEIALAGDRVEVRGFKAQIGVSDLAGELTVTDLDLPRLRFELVSLQADLGELLATFEGEEETGSAAEPGGDEDQDLLTRAVAEGTLRVAEGTWDQLAFTRLDATLRLAGGVATLEPLTMELYDGAFRGRATVDLTADPAPFELRGEVEEVDVDPFLAASLEAAGLLFGRLSGEVEIAGTGADDEAALLASLAGGGSARLEEGRLGGLDVLGAVSNVAGVLGQRTLATLADRLATRSTRFERLAGRFRLEGGRLHVEELGLASPELDLRGGGSFDLTGSGVGGEFEILFSADLSALMRQEGSRAAELFWDPGNAKVILPIRLAGAFDAPSVTVDWNAAVESAASRTVERELGELLGRVFGDDEEEDRMAGPRETGTAPQTPPPDAPPSETPPTADWTPAPAAGRLAAEITDARWGGSILFQDLKLEGVVRGPEIARAGLVVVDAGGAEIERSDRLADVDSQVAAGVRSGEIRWRARIEGKRLALASFPITVTVTVYDPAGGSAEALRVIER